MFNPMMPIVTFLIIMGIAYIIMWSGGGPRGPRGV